MRFDNPITDHGFVLPDLANFTDVKDEWHREEDCDLSKLYEHFSSGDWPAFEAELGGILTDTLKQLGTLDLEKEEDQILFQQLNVTQDEVDAGKGWFDKLQHFFNFYQTWDRNSQKINNPAFNDLYEQGIHVNSVDTTKLNVKLERNIEALLKQEDWRPDPGTFDRGAQLGPNILQDVQQLFIENGFLEAASAYNARQLNVANVFLHVAMPTDQNYKQFFYDCDTVSLTTNMHIDPKEDVIKAMIYLDDVDHDTGPFSYIRGSNRWTHDPLQNIFGRSITTGSYCDSAIKRKSVFRLPSQLRVSHNFGRAVEDGTELSDALLDAEWKITSDMGNAILFDPGAGIHRGGICNTGTRIALQVLMK